MQKHAKVYAQQIAPLVYQLVDENGIICNAVGEPVDWPIQFAGLASEQLEFPDWEERGKNENLPKPK